MIHKRLAWTGLAALAAAGIGLSVWLFLLRDNGPTSVPLPKVGNVDLATLDQTVDDLAAWNRHPEALAQVLAGQRQITANGGDPPRLAELLLVEMDLRAEIDELPEAEAAGIRAIDILDKHFGPNHVETANDLLRLAQFLATSAWKFPQAVTAWRRAIAILDQADSDAWLQPRLDLVEVLSQTSDHVNADTLLGETLAMAVAKQGAESLAAARVHLAHSAWIEAAMKVDTGSANLGIYEAEMHLDRAWNILRTHAPPGDDLRRVCLKQMARIVDQNDGNRRAILRLLLDEWLLVRNSHGDASLPAIQAGLDYADFIQNESPGQDVIAYLVAAWQQLPPEEHLSEKGKRIFRDLAWSHFCPDPKALLASHLAELKVHHAPGSLALAKAYLDGQLPSLVRQVDSPVAAEALLDDALATVTRHFGPDSPARIDPLRELFLHHYRTGNAVAQKKAADELYALIARNYGKRSLLAKMWLRQAAAHSRSLDPAQRIPCSADLLDAQAAAWGKQHPARLPGLVDLANGYSWSRAPSFRKALFDHIDRLTLPRGSVTNTLWNNLFDFLDKPGRSLLPEAKATMDQVFAIAKAAYGPEHPYLLALLDQQANILEIDSAVFDERRDTHLKRIALAEHIYGKDSIFVDPILVKFSQIESPSGTTGPPLKDIALIRRRLDGFCHRYGQRHPTVATIQMEMAEALIGQGDADGFLAAAKEAVAIARDYRGRLPLLLEILRDFFMHSLILLSPDTPDYSDETERLRKDFALPDDLRAAGLFPDFIKAPEK